MFTAQSSNGSRRGYQKPGSLFQVRLSVGEKYIFLNRDWSVKADASAQNYQEDVNRKKPIMGKSDLAAAINQ